MEHREKHLVYRAGLVPYFVENDGTIRMLFMRPTNHEFGTFTYQLAKGKVEDDDETFYDAAVREAKEELGMLNSNVIKTEEVGNHFMYPQFRQYFAQLPEWNRMISVLCGIIRWDYSTMHKYSII